jgi:[ribosomal protein S5]-alanine N-acetyltransferase
MLTGNRLALSSERLKLLALTRPELALLHNHVRALEAALGLRVARGVLDESTRRAVARRLARMQASPAVLHPWHTYWLVCLVNGAATDGLGMVGFKGPPDEYGAVEIAYSLDPGHQGHGYATEAARALIAWAFENPWCLTIVAPDTLRTNTASSRVLEKLGMQVYASTERAQSWRVERAKFIAAS